MILRIGDRYHFLPAVTVFYSFNGLICGQGTFDQGTFVGVGDASTAIFQTSKMLGEGELPIRFAVSLIGRELLGDQHTIIPDPVARPAPRTPAAPIY